MMTHGASPAIEVLARGACVRAGQVLVCRNREFGNLYLPGGHVDWGEDSAQALRREWREELGADCRVGRLLGVVEQVYDAREGRVSEISLVFAVASDELPEDRPPAAREEHLAFEWMPLEQVGESELLPRALAESLADWCRQVAPATPLWRGFAE
ncbi:MAG: NUDIX domain-containing protein [Lentisphaerae bacterium]|jgi:ADP-ribose pyrophosphatase YjhB (NUDIX family)|nr:NUDIX domain-containing protein [Lentisphaerota bacterium]